MYWKVLTLLTAPLDFRNMSGDQSATISSTGPSPPIAAGNGDDEHDMEESSMGMGPEQTLILSPSSDSDCPKTPQSSLEPDEPRGEDASDSTEIEYYSTETEVVDNTLANDGDENDSSCENFGGRVYRGLQRVSSRLSEISLASEAFSLPLGSQDDVSSLEDDQVVPHSLDGGVNVDEIHRKEGHGPEPKGEHRTTQVPSPMDVVFSPNLELPGQGDSNLASVSTPLLPSFPSDSLDLPETVQEDENDGSESSSKVNGMLTDKDEKGDGVGRGEEDEIKRLTQRMSKSLFLAPGASLLSATRSQLRPSVAMDDLDFEEYAKNFPPELDFEEARKYIAQLADAIPDILGSPVRFSEGRHVLGHMTPAGSHAEYTEITFGDDDGDILLDLRLPRTPQNGRMSGLPRSTRESLLSYDYTEIVEDSSEDEDLVEEIVEVEEIQGTP
jgi:hypothetical protein